MPNTHTHTHTHDQAVGREKELAGSDGRRCEGGGMVEVMANLEDKEGGYRPPQHDHYALRYQ